MQFINWKLLIIALALVKWGLGLTVFRLIAPAEIWKHLAWLQNWHLNLAAFVLLALAVLTLGLAWHF